MKEIIKWTFSALIKCAKKVTIVEKKIIKKR